ncbi:MULTISPECIES: restriction endonuclease subunit S [Aerococcus]|uniref:Restriction endonuclease subunit S n=1 Tax=Aerococcus tenax TaxID=3078812 RepID=A0A5N1BL33_9LACT|nr:restriction endonuclease subunit S [Aerococcus urinae]KAA9240376.1 restriction endonuclease subunit S [Aerococcus urinae]MDK7302758.1 restriction endonuclease subunit S [Aerococcus urinae]MDK7801458.1 restriction endonuclease subunit S [Aerococcus urinae]MDK8655002.1 restriction endonuclease subunit S [Aerococcus urinae]RAV70798.1 restriction endonuclease subunit S [Aerococcus urinae]
MTRKMKDSGIEWIGEIPENWSLTRIAGLYSLRNTKVNDVDYPPLSVTKKGILPQLETAAKSDDHNNRKLVKKGDFVINSRSDRKGSSGISPFEGSVSLINTVLAPLETMNPQYFDWLFSTPSFADEFYSRGNGIVDDLWTTNWKKMKDIVVPNPTLDMQSKIANYLNEKTNIINDIYAKVTNEVSLLKDYKNSIITEAVTKGLDKDAQMKDSGIEWIGEIPEHWRVVKLKHITDLISKGMGPNYVEDGEVPVVNQATFSKGYFDYDLNYCNNKIPNASMLQKNDVLLATTGGGVLGKSFLFEEDENYIASTDVCFIRCSNPYYAKFIYYILSINYDLLNGIYAKGSTNQIHLQMEMFKNMPIPIPKDTELMEIIDYLDSGTARIESSISLKEKQLSILDSYKKSLIYEYVTGKKEVPDA